MAKKEPAHRDHPAPLAHAENPARVERRANAESGRTRQGRQGVSR